MSEPRPFPTPLQAALLTLMGGFFATAIAVAVSDSVSPTAALGLGITFGFGAAGALGASSVPSPHGERVGLRGIALRHLLPILLLLPVAIVASEVDNVVKLLLPAPDAPAVAQETLEKVPTDTRLALIETVVVVVGIVPIVEEWFFRGVVQQGMIANAGVRGGIFLTALLFAVGHGGPAVSPQSWAALLASTLVLGLAFGYARHMTGSIVAPILLHVGVNGLAVASLALPGRIVIPGYNAPGDHTPLALLVPSVLAVVAGIALLSRERPSLPPPPPPPEPEEP